VGLKNLKVLKAHHNKFSVLPNEIAAFQLQELDLHSNQLVTLPPWLLVKLSNLEVLNVSDNQLVHLPPANHHDDHNNLVELLAGMNQLKNDVMDSISHLKRLKVLVLCHNRISELPQDSFHGLESLRVLNLSGNPITYIPSSLENCSSLEKLVVSGCRLNSSPSLDSLQHLQEIDFSHNDLENLQLSAGVGTRIKFLDISGNIHLELLELSEKTLEQLSYIDHVVVDELFEFDIPPGLARAEQIGQPPHGAWAYGIANVSGQIPELPCGCASHVAVSSVNRSTDAVYGVVDGGRSRDACSAVKTVLATIIEEEYDMYQEEMEEKSLTQDPKADRMSTLSEDSMDRLLYLRQSMLSCHRKMGAVGARSGSSVFACHIVHKRTTGTINLNLVSTGSCEGLLGREKGVVTVIPPHSLKTHRREMRRIAELGGTISEDFRLNTTTCGVSRLVGFYHLWPYMIPYPDISEIILSPSDRFLLIANDQVWRCLPHRVAEKIIMETSSPSYAAKKLRDTAMAFGCKGSVSIMLLKFNQRKMEVLLGSKPAKRPRSAHRSVSLRIPEDTHHYRLEIDTPGPLIDLSGGDEVGLHEVDEVTDIDALSYGSPEHEKWTNLDEPISPLTPPPGFGFDDDVFVSSTPSHPPPNIVARNTDSNVDTKQNGAEVVTSGFIVEDIENIESGIEEPTEVFDFDKDNLHEQILSNNLPNLLDSDAQDKNGEQQFYFCNSDGF
jgi:adenylate cyclase